jgi:hypothetical protein
MCTSIENSRSIECYLWYVMAKQMGGEQLLSINMCGGKCGCTLSPTFVARSMPIKSPGGDSYVPYNV